MVPGWVGTSLVRTFRVDLSGQSIHTRQVPGETDVLVWRRMVDDAARCGAGRSWPQTAFWAITPVKSLGPPGVSNPPASSRSPASHATNRPQSPGPH